MLKLENNTFKQINFSQPPSGGCVLKQADSLYTKLHIEPAAFRRLCVETASIFPDVVHPSAQPPSGGCVLKHFVQRADHIKTHQPPSGGCVLKRLSRLKTA